MSRQTHKKGQQHGQKKQKRNRTNRTTTTTSSSDDGDHDDHDEHLVRSVSDDVSASEDLHGIEEVDSNDDESMEEEERNGGSSNPILHFVRQVGFSCYQFKEQSKIKTLQYQLTKKQKRFGVEYLDLIETGTASQQQLKSCLNQSMKKIIQIQKEINDIYDAIEERKSALYTK